MPLKLLVLASGRGSNVDRVARSIKEGKLDCEIVAVVTNVEDAGVIDIAATHGLPCYVVPSRSLKRRQHEEELLAFLAEKGLNRDSIDFVLLAGYMRILTGHFLSAFKEDSAKGSYYRVVNIHPSLLPSFTGATAYADAFAAGVAVSGVTVHLVDEEVDHGPILAQAPFFRKAGDDFESFACRGLELEHILLPAVLSRLAKLGTAFALSSLPFDMGGLSG
ncbi:MAG: phosphoribosylglycinamide formyltransferase [Candidatus Melainabacteria bacterium]|nr:phosphoribosylglycinamide formyltransferase [Candidatus Melainabacteria bacterium]OPZ88190.1 MAG: Phosphoribosylglycinamide formyltransferase [bacterium ADurb.Bin425]